MLIIRFVIMSLIVGVVAGIVPAIFFSKINAVQVLKGSSSLKIFKTLSLRKALIVVQYGFSLMFISATLIGYHQYKGFIDFDLGFRTDNILNVRMQGSRNEKFKNELTEIPGVDGMSVSRMISGTGSLYGGRVLYNNKTDSASITFNAIDENYIPLHKHVIIAGRNFNSTATSSSAAEVIVTEKFLRDTNIGNKDPWKSLGQVVFVDHAPKTIVGVIKDFAYTTAEQPETATIFMFSKDEPWGYVNIVVNSKNLFSTVESIQNAWKKNDPIHPIDAVFYDDAIERNYGQFMVMVKVIGFLSFLAICIASMGMFGMVVFATETRLREISVRKVLGASEARLIYILARGFVGLLAIAAAVALPLTYIFFDKVVLISFTRHEEIRWTDLLLGFAGISFVAIVMIISQTLKAARVNPAEVLKNE